MDIAEVSNIIHRIAEGFEDAILTCLEENSSEIVAGVQSQIYSGIDGNDELLSPTYDDDPYFDEEGPWYHRALQYKQWKMAITPPRSDTIFGTPARPDNVPNLYINGKFFSEINAYMQGDELIIDPGNGNGPSIVAKYGDALMMIGSSVTQYFNYEYTEPAIERLFAECGYQ